MVRICFLFNHDQTHQIAHSLPIALELASLRPDAQIIIATTTPRISDAISQLLPATLAGNIVRVELRLRRALSRGVDMMMGGVLPAAKILIYRDNLDFFRSLDVLVVSEKTSLILKRRYGLSDLKIVHTRHGAGDRAIGFDPASREFELILCSGPKIRDRLVHETGVSPDKIFIVGYPKFDTVSHEKPGLSFDTGGRKIVVYNPHPSPHLSSWFKDGQAVLDFFLHHDEYFLIFAPHVMLFERKFVLTIDRLSFARTGKIAQKYYDAPNIHIDLGSPASTDMTYTNAADIYLGDVSSQIYEFLYTPRPCLFMNSHAVDYKNDKNYAHWEAGPVIEGPHMLADGLRQAIATHDQSYRNIQEAMFRQSFALTHEPSSLRAARVISNHV